MISPQQSKRLKVFLILISLFLLLLTFRFGWLMLRPSNHQGNTTSPNYRIQRGSIYDRNGHLLAVQTRLYSASAWIPHIKDPESTARILGDILDIDKQYLYDNFTNKNRSRFMYIQRKISLTATEEIKDLLEKGALPGITLHPEPGRNYPEVSYASHILGYVGLDNTGLDGLEHTLEQTLAPPSIRESESPVMGNDVYLTIDINTQFVIKEIAQQAYEKEEPNSMMVLVMSAKTGELMGYVSLPDFDPNSYQNFSVSERLNRPAVLSYEPGSVFKIFTIASFLNLKGIDKTTAYETSNGYNPEIFKKYDIPPISDLGKYGRLDIPHVLMKSSNVGSAFASDTVSRKDFYTMLRKFGFGSVTGLPIPGESNGILNPVKEWSPRSKPTIAIGQEIGVSAIQMISAATAFTNDGILLKPHIIKQIVAPDGAVIKEYQREPIRSVLSAGVARDMLLMMEKVVSDPEGTVTAAHIPGLRISAKSGTAQMIDPKTGLYSESNYIASVMGIVPTEDPELIIYVVIETPTGDSYYGGRIAAPVLKDIITALAPYYNIPIKGNTIIHGKGKASIGVPPAIEHGPLLPNFRGQSKRQIVSYFKESDMQFEISGEGWVIEQSPPHGTIITPGMEVKLWFK